MTTAERALFWSAPGSLDLSADQSRAKSSYLNGLPVFHSLFLPMCLKFHIVVTSQADISYRR